MRINNKENAYYHITEEIKSAAHEYSKGYKDFLNHCKTERECTERIVSILKDHGFTELKHGQSVKPGDRVYRIHRLKSVYAAVVGSAPLSEGVNIAAAHIDNPRLDLKTNPLYEDQNAYFKTHYYGGIRKHHWFAIPLSLHGVVYLADGTGVTVVIGEDPADPVFTIPDLLPHLADKQKKLVLEDAYEGEQINVLIGSEPDTSIKDGTLKATILSILNEKYGITEDDFASAELSVIPAFKSRDVGLDRSMIGSYGQDDRVCAYAALMGLLKIESPAKTAICLFADKEEVGNSGITSMETKAFDTFMLDLCTAEGIPVDYCYENSLCLSMDVTGSYDPNFYDVFDPMNEGYMNRGISVMKYSGSRGKIVSSDASAETVARIRKIFDSNNVIWYISELGKVDIGGGGTVALCMAVRNIDVIDAGTPVLGMHSTFEVTGKLDCYMTHLAAKALFESR